MACRNSGFNSVGSITQANSGYVGNNDGDVNYENAVDISQRINQANGCDESVDGNTVEGDPNVATCENTAPNTIGPITQTNQGFTDNNDGDVNYENAVDIDQEVNQLNDCDEEDGGFNQAICTNTSSISLGSITQANSGYTGNNDGDVNYENAVDVSQRTNQANTCSEFGFGDYGVGAPPQLVGICTNIGNNAVGSITQANSGYTGNNDGDVNYKNAVDIDQEVNQLNACDEFGGGNLANACRNSGSNSVGNIAQTNSGYAGNNDGDVNYKNAVDISQRINQANNCDESGGFPVGARSNNAICENTASNSVGSITQVNTGYPNNNGGDTSYQNAVDIDQEINQANRCSEADDGGNDAVCTNTATNTIGSIAQANQGYAGNNHGDTSYKNAVDLDQQVTQTNDCDENGAGGNNARCNNQASNSVGDISQSNDGDGKNDIDIDQKTSQKNDCDENGAGDNNARCSNKASNSVGDMSQSNDDDEEESEETNTSEENDDNNDNDDNDKEDQKESGENDKEDDDEKDIDVDQDVSQENDCTGNCSNDGTNSADSD